LNAGGDSGGKYGVRAADVGVDERLTRHECQLRLVQGGRVEHHLDAGHHLTYQLRIVD
jgi:hypothetical protein